MRTSERMKGNRPVQAVITDEQYRRLRIRAAMESTSISDLIRIRLADIIDPEADFAAMTVPR